MLSNGNPLFLHFHIPFFFSISLFCPFLLTCSVAFFDHCFLRFLVRVFCFFSRFVYFFQFYVKTRSCACNLGNWHAKWTFLYWKLTCRYYWWAKIFLLTKKVSEHLLKFNKELLVFYLCNIICQCLKFKIIYILFNLVFKYTFY